MSLIGSAVHFGAGALGRGLVIPRLVAAGWSVMLADADAGLVAALSARRGYPLTVTDGKRGLVEAIAIEDALGVGEAALQTIVARASLVTTAVRRENLRRVAAGLVAAWRRHGMPKTVTVVGCENVERIDDVLDAAFATAGIAAAQRERLVLPRSVVDRICAADWPATLGVTTEPFSELAIGGDATVPGIDSVPDIDARFARKRYLVNTFADASAILGATRGHRTLAAAINDQNIQDTIAPLLAALLLHLEAAYGYSRASLEEYLARCRERLANAAIPRRVETVARDLLRKLGPKERFAEPLIDLETRRELGDPAVNALAVLIRAAVPASSPSTASAYGETALSPAARRFYNRLDRALASST